jgi:hypothetical protein
MKSTGPTPPPVKGGVARILASALGALRGDKYMVGAYPPDDEPDIAPATPPAPRAAER